MYQIYYIEKNQKAYYVFNGRFQFDTEKEARKKFKSLTEKKRRVSFIEHVKKEEGRGV